jgi:hypothetical protein
MADITNPELIGLERQRAMAQALLKRGMETPQGQMVSGRFVGASPIQYLGNLFNQYAGQKGLEAVDTQQLALAEALKNKENANLQTGLNQYYGTPEFIQQGPTPTGGNIPVQPATQPDRRLALATLLAPEGGATSRAIASKLLEQEFEKAKQHVVSPGAVLVDEKGNKLYQAPNRPLVGDGMGGMEGRFNKKGDYITSSGTPIFKSEVVKDREIVKTAEELRRGLNEIKPEDVNKSSTILGDVTQGGFKGYIAKQLGNEAVAAQNKINASSVMQTLQNLPPGPASDKDIAQAKSSFPGYGDAKALNEWLGNTKAMLDRKINLTNQKYGSEDWYGANPISAKPAPKGKFDANNLPAGVTKEMWNVMTPEEKASF